jgi:glycosyltransferase involved in cell wall biosynthesis
MPERTRILIVSSTFPRWHDDTMPPFIYLLCEALSARGFEMHVLAPHAPDAAIREQLGTITVHRFRYAPAALESLAYGGGILENLRLQPWRWVLVPGFLLGLAVALMVRQARIKFDLIHAHWIVPQGVVTAVLKSFVSAPILLSAHGSDVFTSHAGSRRRLVRFALKKHRRVTVNSAAMKAAVRELGNIEASVVPMGVDVQKFRCERPRLGGETIEILFVGRLTEVKGLRYLIDAITLLKGSWPQIRLQIIGDGPDREILQRQVNELNLEEIVVFTGAVPHDELARYYAAADILVAPSVVADSGATEALGVVLLEAAAAALPIVATNVGGIGDIISDQRHGLLVEQKSPQQIAAALRRLLEDPVSANAMGRAAQQKIAEHFSWDAIAGQFAEVYRGLSPDANTKV